MRFQARAFNPRNGGNDKVKSSSSLDPLGDDGITDSSHSSSTQYSFRTSSTSTRRPEQDLLSCTPPRAVGFDECCNCYHDTPPFSCDSDIQVRWYTPFEIDRMKDAQDDAIYHWKRAESQHHKSKQQQQQAGPARRLLARQNTFDDPFLLAGAIVRVYHACGGGGVNCASGATGDRRRSARTGGAAGDSEDANSTKSGGLFRGSGNSKVTKSMMKDLTRELERTDITGMEHLLSKALRQDKRHRRETLVQLVKQHAERTKSTDNNNNKAAETLREQCQQITIPAQLFASCVAKARAGVESTHK